VFDGDRRIGRILWMCAVPVEAGAATEITMLARPALTKRPDATTAEKPKGQARPAEERFLLRVDGQTKRSFSSKGPAITSNIRAS
jgi:hypothetical protein